MIAVGEDIGLKRQIRAAAIDQIDARQVIGLGNFLRAQVLFDRCRIVGTALHSRIIAGDHHLTARDAANTRNHARAAYVAAIHAVCSKLADLQKRRSRIQQPLHPLTRQKLTAGHMAFAVLFGAAKRGLGDMFAQFLSQRLVMRKTRLGFRALAVECRSENGCGQYSVSRSRSYPPLRRKSAAAFSLTRSFRESHVCEKIPQRPSRRSHTYSIFETV